MRCIVINYSVLTVVILLHPLQIYSQDISFRGYEKLLVPPLQYVVYRSIDSLIVDGHATELSWQKAMWSDSFVDIEGDKQLKPALDTRFKMIWNQDALYLYAEMDEPHVWATVMKHDDVVFNDNDFEVFIDPDGDTHSYFEIEVNALATLFDLFLPKPYRNSGSALIPWDVRDIKVAVCVDGSLNNADDTDRKWSLEMAIPFRSVSVGNRVQVPVNGSYWRINFSRVEWDVALTGSGYEKKQILLPTIFTRNIIGYGVRRG